MNRNWLACIVLATGFATSAKAALEFTNVTGVIALPNLPTLNAVAYDSSNTFAAVGDNSAVLSARFTTSMEWNSNGVPGTPLSLKAVTHGAGRFAAGGAEALTFSSPNGTSWTQTANNPFGLAVNVQGLAFNPSANRFAAVAAFVNISYADAALASWTAATINNSVLIESFRGVAALPGNEFIACGLRGDIRISQNSGATWNVSRAFSATEPDLFGIASGGGRILSVGAGGRVMVSTDGGTTWATNSTATPVGITNYAVAFTGDEFIVVGHGGLILTGTNANPAHWTTNAILSASPVNTDLRGVAFASASAMQGVALVVGNNGTVILGGTRPAPPANPVNQAICEGAANLPLSVSIETSPNHPLASQTVDWYSAPTGGTLLLAGSPTFTPNDSLPASPNAPSNYVYFAEQRDLRTGFGSATRTAVTNTVFPNTIVVSAPVNSTNCPGTTATFAVSATGFDLTYQWRSNNVNLVNSAKYSGVTTPTLTINNITAADALVYSVVVSGYCNNVTNSATLTVLTNTSAVGPVAQTNCPGTTATFSTVASGTGPFTYQWRSNNINLSDSAKYSGTTTATLNIANVTAADALVYSVVVNGFCTSVTNSATLTVLTNVSAVGPGAQTNCPGTTATFSTVASGTGPFTYQWRSNNINLSDSAKYSGVTTATLNISNVTAADALAYSVVVSGFCTSVTNNATLTVLTNVSAIGPVARTNCPDTTASFSTTASGTGPFTYQWRSNNVNLSNSSKYSGVNTDTLIVSNVTAADALVYSVVVSGGCTSVTNSAALTVLTNVSAVGPVAQTNCAGSTTIFSTLASGTGPFNYQWRTNGVNLVEGSKHSGVTTATLQVNNVSTNDAVTYSVVVSGFCTSVTNSATLTVQDCGLLTISRLNDTSVVVEWLGNLALESATNLAPPINWAFLTNGVAGATNRWTNSILPPPTNRFFRLNTNSP